MVTNFEDITAKLSQEERKLIPVLIRGFQRKTKSRAVKSNDILLALNKNLAEYGLKQKITGPRLRKLCNIIRTKGILPLIATSKGYYVSYDRNEVLNEIHSLRDRAFAILNSAKGLEKFIQHD
jgi:uncharacterized Fe-S center protein